MAWPKGVPRPPETVAKILASRSKVCLKKRRATREEDGQTLYRCSKCKGFFVAAGFYRSKSMVDGLTPQCKKCHCRTNLASRNVDIARDSCRAYMRRARKANPEKFRERERNWKRPKSDKTKARQILNASIRRGEITRPQSCEQCGGKGQRIEAHHPDYSKPLEVVWLCTLCHGKAHRSRRKEQGGK